MGFVFKYMLGGGVVYLTSFVVKSGASIAKGDMVKITSGEADVAASGDGTIFGVAANDADEGEVVKLYPPDAVYAVSDASARTAGDCLDLNETSDGVAEKVNDDLVVVRNCGASDASLVVLHSNARLFSNAS